MTTNLIAAFFVVVATAAGAAESYPSRPIRIVDPFAPGGSTEAQARALAAKLHEAWGQPVVIDARPGAASALGSQLVAQATPDGHTLLFNNVGVVTAPLLSRKPPFDPLKDFAPVILVGTQAQFVVVHPSLPGTLREFVQYAKANPGKVNFGSSGVGGSSHLSMELFKSAAGVKERFARIGIEPAGGTPQELAKLMASEARKWSKVIADAGIPKE